jgi:transposase-like protein
LATGRQEDAEAWLAFLSLLEQQGLRGENGLELIIHDGGSGLCAALQTVHFAAAAQRCLFHKLRNIWDAIHVADDLPAAERKRQRRSIFRDFVAILQAKQLTTVLHRALRVVQNYRATQPAAVAALRRDFRAASPTSACTPGTPPGNANTCAPSVASNASTAACVVGSAAPTPTIRTPESWL